MLREKAEIGVGAVVAFVALILVVAVAVGVLINAVVFLQDQTGEGGPASEADAQFQIQEADLAVNQPGNESVAVGARDGSSSPVAYEIRIELSPAEGADDIDLSELELELEGEERTAVLTHVSDHVENGDLVADDEVDGTAVARGVFFVQPLAVERVDTVMSDSGDRYELVIPIGTFVDHEGAVRDGPASDARVTAPVQDYEDADIEVAVPGVFDAGQGIDNTGLQPLESSDSIAVQIRTADGTERSLTIDVPSLEEDAGGQVPVRRQ
jgi:archaellin